MFVGAFARVEAHVKTKRSRICLSIDAGKHTQMKQMPMHFPDKQ